MGRGDKVSLRSTVQPLLTSKKAYQVSVILNLFQDLDETLKLVQGDVRRKLGKLCAFTLAEVLVTLGVIGVVSAMTIPTLMTNHQRKVYVTQLHKVYNEVQQAFDLYISDKRAINLREAGLRSNDDANTFIETYFKTVNKCTSGSFSPCFAASYKSIDGSWSDSYANESDCSAAYSLASGAAICIAENGIIGVDVNGSAGPNVAGKDLFEIYWGNSGITTNCSNDTDYASACKSSYGNSCFCAVVNAGWQINY